MVIKRTRSIPHSFGENIATQKAKLETQLAKLKPGRKREALEEKIRQLDTALEMSDWLSSGRPIP